MTTVRLVSAVPHATQVGELRFAAADPAARVVDVEVDNEAISTPDGPVEVTTLARGGALSDLPAPRPGVLYLVSRLTAQAAHDRDDLVFVYEEQRDPAGQIIGAKRLARYARPQRPRRTARRRAVVRKLTALKKWRPGTSLSEFSIAIFAATGTAFAGGVLGIVPDIVQDGIGRSGNRIWSALTFAFLAVAFFWLAYLRYARAREQQQRAGTAYFIEEEGIRWTSEEREAFLGMVRRRFAASLKVLRVKDVDLGWEWPHERGRQDWDSRVDIVVSAFWAARVNDRAETENAVFVWAYWPVALAFASRAIARKRGLGITVWQRPSFGRVGSRPNVEWHLGPHRFIATDKNPELDEVAPGVDRKILTGEVDVEVEDDSGTQDSDNVAIMLVRLTPGPWGPLRVDDWPSGATRPRVVLRDCAGLGLRSGTAVLYEWRWITPNRYIPWAAYPSLAEEIARWISELTTAEPSKTWLLGMQAPAELAVGIGIRAAQFDNDKWPQNLWPISYDWQSRQLAVPYLNLGIVGIKPSGVTP